MLLLPVIIYNLKQKQKAAAMLRDLNAVAQHHGMQVSKHTFWNGLAIGLDASKRKVLYLGMQSREIVVDLDKATDCKLRYEYNEQNGSRIVELVSLQIRFRDRHLPEQELLFYTKEGSLAFNQELLLAREWHDLMQEQIQQKQPIAAVAS